MLFRPLADGDILKEQQSNFEDLRRGEMGIPQASAWKTRLVERGFPDRSFDIEFWQEQGDEAIFAAAWELVELAEEINHGRKPTLQRTATALKRI